MELLDPGVDAAVSNRDLQTLIERETMEMLTLDALTRSDRGGDLENE